MPRPKDYERRTNTSFKKTYGKRVYSFHHVITEIPGYVSGITTVRVKSKRAPKNQVGELVHCITWEKEIKEHS